MIPAVLRGILIESYHATPFGGHFGVNKMVSKMSERFYWPEMEACIKDYIKRCHFCNFHKLPPQRRMGFLSPINPFKALENPGIFSMVSIDLLGPFPESRAGNKMIAVLTDYCSRYVICGALEDGTAQEVAKFLVEKVICIYGCFRILLSDRGSCFRSRLLVEMGKVMGFKRKFTSSFHPQTNGLTERFNSTLAKMLAMFIGETGYEQWDAYLPHLTFAHNSSRHSTLGVLPYFLMFGREPILPMDLTFVRASPSLPLEGHKDRMREAFEMVRKNLEKRQEQNRESYDASKRDGGFEIGELVTYQVPIRKKGVPDKFQRKVRGPYRITNCLSNLAYEIEPLEGHKIRDTAHVSRLISYHRPQEIVDPAEEEVTQEPPVDDGAGVQIRKTVHFDLPDRAEKNSLQDGVTEVNEGIRAEPAPVPRRSPRLLGRK